MSTVSTNACPSQALHSVAARPPALRSVWRSTWQLGIRYQDSISIGYSKRVGRVLVVGDCSSGMRQSVGDMLVCLCMNMARRRKRKEWDMYYMGMRIESELEVTVMMGWPIEDACMNTNHPGRCRWAY